MDQPGHREVEHQIDVNAPAATVHRMIEAVEDWPNLFPPTVHVDRFERSGTQERIRIWAFANGEVKTWTSRRVLDPERLRIEFRQEVPAAPVAAMGGTWIVEPAGDAASTVRLLHDYRAAGDDPEKLAWIERAVDGNSQAELAALKAGAEAAAGTGEPPVHTFEDSVVVNGTMGEVAGPVYDFLNEAKLWEERLPHVSRVDLTEDTPGLQLLEMDTKAKNGSTHTTKSVRVCFPQHTIVYKQIGLPALLTLHTGIWRVAADGPSGVRVTSSHTVAINTANITAVLGADAGVPEARDFVRDALGTNSLATLRHAKEYAENRP
ncbi:cyclase [Actinomadura soli]|uniref:Cyclase n=1 Tax=Actinomadura soli TaxID=2508997 RepID=A0A5C4JDT8_9ACTN|nr:aromatase/cyclase [Actinomadura soli]TMR02605.1 cyclase [Actinomadura soli]